jgi:hypothetical protein
MATEIRGRQAIVIGGSVAGPSSAASSPSAISITRPSRLLAAASLAQAIVSSQHAKHAPAQLMTMP